MKKNKYIKSHIMHAFQTAVLSIHFSFFVLMMNGCTVLQTVAEFDKTEEEETLDKEMGKLTIASHYDQFNKVILFCGNPGVGKSSLCNSIFQQEVFESGLSLGQGMTKTKQEYTYDNVTYIDTPGLADVKLREQAAKEIEFALKENGNYKIVFVATLQAGRIVAQDLVTINTVCDAITAPFEYGVIFNKVTKGVIRHMEKNKENLLVYLDFLHKKPSNVIVIMEEEAMREEDNAFLPEASENRIKLLEFIDSLPDSNIREDEVGAIDITYYEKKIQELETKLNIALKSIGQKDQQINNVNKENLLLAKEAAEKWSCNIL